MCNYHIYWILVTSLATANIFLLDGHTRYGVFCLFRVGNQVMDTPTLVEVDRNTMDIIFKDTVIL